LSNARREANRHFRNKEREYLKDKISETELNRAGHVARMGEEGKLNKILVGKPEGKRHSEDQGIGGKMGSEWILGRLAWGCG
jgi:hypothetical protein